MENEISSRKCLKCSLCGKHGNTTNMVLEKTTITDRRGKDIQLQKNLNCSSYGVYAAECRLCQRLYVGQTINKFSIRWNSHRNSWKNLCLGKEKLKEDSDNGALFKHYKRHHQDADLKTLQLADAYGVMFIEQPTKRNLDIRESYWIAKLNASINIAKTILPKIW